MNVELLCEERGALKVNRSDVESHSIRSRRKAFISVYRTDEAHRSGWLLASGMTCERDDREIANPSEISLELRARKRTAIFIKYFGGVRGDWKNSRNRTSYKNTENSTAAAMAQH